MSNPFTGEIRIFAGDFAPVGWVFCHGQILPIAVYESFFNLIGTIYGGDGQETFAVPDLRGRLPVHVGPEVQIGQFGGAEQIALPSSSVPAHSHVLQAATQPASIGIPTGNYVADTTANGTLLYGPIGSTAAMSPAAIEPVGASSPHENRMPYLAMHYIICVDGIFPPRN
jgi:microcystin-dependent protein